MSAAKAATKARSVVLSRRLARGALSIPGSVAVGTVGSDTAIPQN